MAAYQLIVFHSMYIRLKNVGIYLMSIKKFLQHSHFVTSYYCISIHWPSDGHLLDCNLNIYILTLLLVRHAWELKIHGNANLKEIHFIVLCWTSTFADIMLFDFHVSFN